MNVTLVQNSLTPEIGCDPSSGIYAVRKIASLQCRFQFTIDRIIVGTGSAVRLDVSGRERLTHSSFLRRGRKSVSKANRRSRETIDSADLSRRTAILSRDGSPRRCSHAGVKFHLDLLVHDVRLADDTHAGPVHVMLVIVGSQVAPRQRVECVD